MAFEAALWQNFHWPMNLKRSRAVLLLFLLLLLAGGSSCKKRPPVTAPPPPAPSAPSALDVATESFARGDYPRAARYYEIHLEANPPRAEQEEALFHLALSYALPGSPIQDLQRAAELFGRFVRDFPDSPLVPQTNLILELQAQIQTLQEGLEAREKRIRELSVELETLKQIDLQRRRPRTQP